MKRYTEKAVAKRWKENQEGVANIRALTSVLNLQEFMHELERGRRQHRERTND